MGGLRSAIQLGVRRAGVLLHPPGSSPFLAALIAIAGLDVGLNTEYTVAEVLAVRTLLTDGVATFMGALRALPDPSDWAAGAAVLMTMLVLLVAGGWVNVIHALVRGEEPSEAHWISGILHSGRAVFWLGSITLLVAGVVAAVGLMTLEVFQSLLEGTLASGVQTLAMPLAASLGFGLAVVLGLYVLGSTYLMGVVAIVEPGTSLWRIPGRSRAVYKAGKGGTFFWRAFGLFAGWFVLKLALMQVIVPFAPMPEKLGTVVSIAGSILNGLLMVGDGLVALLALVMAVQIYHRGAERLTP